MPGAYSSGYSGAYGSGPSGVITATPPSRIYVVTHGDEASCINKFQPKDPDAILDYGFDWSGWLAAGESIASHEIKIGRASCRERVENCEARDSCKIKTSE